ncbi:MAG: glycine-rich protein [Nocardioides sp.]
MPSLDPLPTQERPRGRRSAIALVLATLAPALAAGATLGVEVATAPPAHAAGPGCSVQGVLTTCTYTFFGGGVDSWTVPAEVEKATFTVLGAAGGSAAGRPGGRGGGVIATLDVTPGHQYGVVVGGRGGSDTDDPGIQGRGGWNGGGNGAGPLNPGGGGGGGASEIQLDYSSGPRILVGGGGGGAGSNVFGDYPRGVPGAGGDGGGTGNGHQGGNVSGAWVGAGGGGGGTATAAGSGGGRSAGTLPNGCGAFDDAAPTQGDAGYADSYGRQFGGAGGHLASVWNGNNRCDQYRGWGGGGGGGWRAGGGGGGGITGGAGGGGGSGYAPPGSTSILGEPGANGLVTISFLNPSNTWLGQGGAPMTSAPTSVARPQTGHLFPIHDVFYLNSASQVIQRVVTEGVPSPEHNFVKTMYPGSTVAAIWRPGAGGRLDIFGRGPENALWQRSFSWKFGWRDWHIVPADITMTSSPTVFSPDGTRLDVVYRDSDNRLQQATSREGIWAPKPTAVPGGPIVTTAPGATDTDSGRADLFAGCSGALCWWTSTNGTWAYRGTVPATSVTSPPAVSSPRDGWIEVMVRDQNNAMSRLMYAVGGDWFGSTAPVPSPSGSPVTRVSGPGGTSITYARGLDDRLTGEKTGSS